MTELRIKHHKIDVWTTAEHLVGFSEEPVLEVNKKYAVLRGEDGVIFASIHIDDISSYKISVIFYEDGVE